MEVAPLECHHRLATEAKYKRLRMKKDAELTLGVGMPPGRRPRARRASTLGSRSPLAVMVGPRVSAALRSVVVSLERHSACEGCIVVTTFSVTPSKPPPPIPSPATGRKRKVPPLKQAPNSILLSSPSSAPPAAHTQPCQLNLNPGEKPPWLLHGGVRGGRALPADSVRSPMAAIHLLRPRRSEGCR